MQLTHAGRTRQPRHTPTTTLSLAAVTAVAAFLVAPAPAHATLVPPDQWSGVWHTHHEFGNPTLHLDLERQDGPDVVKGWYQNDGGGGRGKISGEVSRAHGDEVWEGKFRDDDGGSKGKFRVKLDSSGAHFDGWFKTCGRFLCSSKYDWAGDHA
ncbi:hypothetical protein [Nocardioides sp.]|uniref:hypothetical protein n=1 Tax=Nocardioides sp. TaxID=35761 RepID=UPI00378354DD